MRGFVQFAVVSLLVNAAFASILVPQQAFVPRNTLDKHTIITAPQMVVDGVTYDTGYNTLLRVGERAALNDSLPFGTLTDITGKPVYRSDKFGNPIINKTKAGIIFGEWEASDNPDFTSILRAGSKLYSFVHFEAPQPAAVYLVELKQDKDTCGLKAVKSTPVNWTAWDGLWTPCAGSVSPWNTHLGSEEYEPDARKIEEAVNVSQITDEKVIEHMRYWGFYRNTTTLQIIREYFNPYKFGHITEMSVDTSGRPVVRKHYSLGRQAFELPYVMPDRRTVYATDDGENTIMTMFKADKAADLSCGVLFAPKFVQMNDGKDGGQFEIDWIDLGHACDDELEDMVDDLQFSDIFKTASPNKVTGDCPAGFESINTTPGLECLQLVRGMEKAASRFETRRYAAYVGGTTEMSKWEGFTFAADKGSHGTIYTAISDVRNGMEDFRSKDKNSTMYDLGGNNDVRLVYNPCGCVYAIDVDSSYNATNMYPLLCGNTKTNTDEFNGCDVNAISSPDNVAYVRGHNALLIGEDTSMHQNDVVWLYQFESKQLRRLQTTPFGAETTSPYWYPDVDGCAYMMSVVQHPYGESDQDRAGDLGSSGVAARIGYLGPFAAQVQTFSTRKLMAYRR